MYLHCRKLDGIISTKRHSLILLEKEVILSSNVASGINRLEPVQRIPKTESILRISQGNRIENQSKRRDLVKFKIFKSARAEIQIKRNVASTRMFDIYKYNIGTDSVFTRARTGERAVLKLCLYSCVCITNSQTISKLSGINPRLKKIYVYS